jgi:hypothetical protein
MRNLILILAMITTGMVSAQFKSLKDYTAFVDWDMNPINGVKSKTPTGYILQYSSAEGWNLDQLKEVSGECRKFLEENGSSLSNPSYIGNDLTLHNCDLASFLMGKCEDVVIKDDEYLTVTWFIDEDSSTWYLAKLIFSEHTATFSVKKHEEDEDKDPIYYISNMEDHERLSYMEDYRAYIDGSWGESGVKTKTPTGYSFQYYSTESYNPVQVKEVSRECINFLEKYDYSLLNPTYTESNIYLYGRDILSILMGECEDLTFDCDEDLRMSWDIKEGGDIKYFVTFQLSDGAVSFSADKLAKQN